MDTRHVSSRHDSQEGRQGPSLFQRCGEQARAWWVCGAAARAAFGEINTPQELEPLDRPAMRPLPKARTCMPNGNACARLRL